MAYELPLVRVYQQLANVSPTLAAPDLPACVVGRCYHVMTYAVNKDDIYVEMYDKANGNSFVPQNDIAGTILDDSFVSLYLDDVYIEIVNGTFDLVLNTAVLTDGGEDFSALNIDVGDTVVIDHASITAENESRLVLAVGTTTLTLNKNFTQALTGATYSVQKKLDDRQLLTTDFTISDGIVSIAPALTHIFETVSYPVESGKIYCEYRGLRTDLTSAIDEAASSDEIVTKLGVISADNPLALGCYLAKLNTTTSVKFIAVDTIVGDEIGWSNAKDILENSTSVYYLALLTDSASVIGTFKTHCEQMSTADEHAWRVCSGGIALVTEQTLVTGAAGIIWDDSGTLKFRDNTKTFQTYGVVANDRIVITSPNQVTGSYTVSVVTNENVIEVSSDTEFPVAATAITYTIERSLSKSQQADYIKATIDSYNSKRLQMMWPDSLVVNSETVDGFYLGCVVAGSVAGLPPHQGFTNLGVAGISTLNHSNNYFKKSDLNKIAEAGGCIFVQDTPSSLPYIRHQLTTDTQYVETKELSVVKNFDHLSYYFYDVLTPFIGPYNVTDKTVGLVLKAIKVAAEAKTKAELPKIGAPLKSFTVAANVSGVSNDRVEARVRLDLPRPLNNIDCYLEI